MYGQGNYGRQTSQGLQASIPPPPHLENLSTAFPPPTTAQPPAASHVVMHCGPSAASQSSQPSLPMYERAAPAPAQHNGPPFQAPVGGTVNNIIQSHTPPLQAPPLRSNVPMPGPHINSLQNAQYSMHVGSQNSRHFPTSLLPPPPPPPPPPSTVGSSKREFSQAAPLPSSVRAHTTYWHPVNSRSQQSISMQPPPIFNPNLGPLAHSTSAGTHIPPLAPSPPPLLPSTSTVPVPCSPAFFRPPLPTSYMSHVPSLNFPLKSDPEQINEKVVASELGALESSGQGYSLQSTMDGRMGSELDLPLAPPRPTDEKIIKKIETLCQFIVKNGPGFETMARIREAANPEFKFLFGGDPGSDAAIAHEYYQWAKRKYALLRDNGSALTPSEVSIRTKPSTFTFLSHPNGDSDMEMEDDITQVDKDQEMNKPVKDFCQESDLVRDFSDAKEQNLQCESDEDSLSHKDPCFGALGSASSPNHGSIPGKVLNRVCSDSNPPELDRSGIAEKSTCVQADIFSLSNSSPAAKRESPFRLLQAYASDDSLESDDVEVDTATIQQSAAAASLNGPDHTENKSETDLRAADINKKGTGLPSESGKLYRPPTLVSNVEDVIGENVVTFSEVRPSVKHSDKKHDYQETVCSALSSENSNKKSSLGVRAIFNESGKSDKENEEQMLRISSTAVQVDEFGRLVRKGASDSDSDGSYYDRRHKKRGRSRSRSQSPIGRRMRRRSQQRKREKRSPSRSWSPRRRRSRSPVLRHVKDFGVESTRRTKSRKPECFDFRRGRCYRGASCRYWHHDAEMERSGRQRKRPQTPEMPLRSGKSDVVEETKNLLTRKPDCGGNEVKNNVTQPSKKSPNRSFNAAKQEKGEGSPRDPSDGFTVESDTDKPKTNKEVDMPLQDRRLVREEEDSSGRFPCLEREAVETSWPTFVDPFVDQSLRDVDTLKFQANTADNFYSVGGKSLVESSQCCSSFGVPESGNIVPQLTDNSTKSPLNGTSTILTKLPANGPPDVPHRVSELPQHPHPFLQGVVTQNMQQDPGNPTVLQPSSFASQSTFMGGIPSSRLSNEQQHLYSAPQSSSWSTMTPPKSFPQVQYNSTVNGGGIATVPYPEYQQNHVSRRTEFSPLMLNNNLATVPQSPAGELPHGTYSVELVPDHSHKQREDYRSSSLPAGNPPGQQVSGPDLLRSLHPNEVHPYPSESLAPQYSRLQQQNQSFALQHTKSSVGLDLPGEPISSTMLPHTLARNQTSALDSGGLRRSHYNPYASTFEQPLISKFGSGNLGQEYHGRYSLPFHTSHALIDGIGVGSIGARLKSSSPKSTMVTERVLPLLGGDQYDPLFDSIEHYSNSVKKGADLVKGESVDDSNVVLRTSGSNEPLDVEENNKRKEIGTFAPSLSVDDDGFGETAEAEVGAVENASPTDSVDAKDVAVGEVEIDQVKSPGKGKKRKDSRSMKLFKVALADFVKEVLRPSWRQGNMSKEAFKTIVKKTVDKVTSAMKSHHIPKSQAKINHYIDSSQRKLTKLVMGYVDKYVKV